MILLMTLILMIFIDLIVLKIKKYLILILSGREIAIIIIISKQTYITSYVMPYFSNSQTYVYFY